MPDGPFPVGAEEDDNPWLSVSDLMSGLMIVFLCIAVLFMREQETSINQQKRIAEEYNQVQGDFAKELAREFDAAELERWGAELAGDGLVVRFKDPSTMFTGGDATLTPGFQTILKEFFPQLVAVLQKEAFRSHVREVRIEGHTSSEWIENRNKLPPSDAYLPNMKLSQDRAFSVLTYVMTISPKAGDTATDLRKWLRANGLSSSRLVKHPGTEDEDPVGSRRVEFRVVTDAEDSMRLIVDQVAGATR